MHRAHIIEARTGYDFLDGRAKLKSWQTCLMRSGLAEASVEADFEDRFSDFYLSEETCLGRGDDTSICLPVGQNGAECGNGARMSGCC